MVAIGGMRMKLLALLLLAALLPLSLAGYLSIIEVKNAATDVQDRLSFVNTTSMNRSALAAAVAGDTDQELMVIGKASQYDEFFRRIENGNSVLSAYISSGAQENNCTVPPGASMLFGGGNSTAQAEQMATLKSLCGPTRMLKSMVEMDGSLERSYFATANGVLIFWPDVGEPESEGADPRMNTWYVAAQQSGETVWISADQETGEGSLSMTCATPAYRGISIFGVLGTDVSISSIYSDLSSLRVRGYPFVIDSKGSIVMMPKVKRGDTPWDSLLVSGSLFNSVSSDLTALADKMVAGESGSATMSLGGRDWYIAYAPVKTVGWSLAVAFPSEEMLLPASIIESGAEETAQMATRWLDDAASRLAMYIILIGTLAAALFGGAGFILSGRMSSASASMAEKVRRIGQGNLGVRIDRQSPDELGALEVALDEMREGLARYIEGIRSESYERGRSRRDEELTAELLRNIQAVRVPIVEGYEVAAEAFVTGGAVFYDLIELEDGRIALALGEVSGQGVPAMVLAMISRTLLRALYPIRYPGEVLRLANLRLGESGRGMPVSCFYGLLDPDGRSLEYANAGHAPPFIVEADGTVYTLEGGGISLGAVDNIDLGSEVADLNRGSLLVMYSDDLLAANGVKGRAGLERLIETVRASRELPPSEILFMVEKAMGPRGRMQPGAALLIVKSLL